MPLNSCYVSVILTLICFTSRHSTDSTSMQLQIPMKDGERKNDNNFVKSSVVFDWIESCLSSSHSILHLPSSAISSSSSSSSTAPLSSVDHGDEGGSKEGDIRRIYNSLDRPMKLLEPVSNHIFLFYDSPCAITYIHILECLCVLLV